MTKDNKNEVDHDHVYGPVELSRYTGNPHRKCQVDGCSFISLDLEDGEGECLYVENGCIQA